ncbi:hypothetical protein DSL72_001328 [Monilinia vaccinii-corymbosi]|uniref:Uncharacterized protein n=1 Tax=Monilinia vaccinii-corymbosi TaxID=61207 RepID=A0A8A3P4N2_9HELO|nr:hypothetical protein DSL72_001328 [Monilinia vaccinii-corymbosi]
MDWHKDFDDLFGSKLSHGLPSSMTITKCEGNLLEERETNMEIENEDMESTKPRVRLPVVTGGIINPVAVTQLQDELEDTKKELDKLRAQESSKDQSIVREEWSLPELMETFQKVGDHILAKIGQDLRVSQEEHEAKIKQLEGDKRDNFSRAMEDRRTHPNALIGDVFAKIEVEAYDDQSKRQIIEPKRLHKSVQTTESQTARMTTPDPTSSNNPLQNNRWANPNSLKREHDDAAQPDFGRDLKRSKAA